MTKKPESDRQGSSGRTLGSLKGKLEVPEDFDAPLPQEVLDAFEGQAANARAFESPGVSEHVPTSSSRRTWNYRVISFKQGEDSWCAIHEVYYEGGVPVAYAESPAVVLWDVEEGERVGHSCLDRMREALSKPFLTEEAFRRKG